MAKPVKNPKAEKATKEDIETGVGKVKKAWEEKSKDGKLNVKSKGGRMVAMSKVETVDNVVRVWTSEDTTLPPDYVIVNPPVEEDPLEAIATAIDGVSK